MLKTEAIKQLTSLKFILQQINANDYKQTLTTLKGASIGKHVQPLPVWMPSLTQ